MTSDNDGFDDLADLKSALGTATPRPDPEARAANLRLAQANFEKIHMPSQGSANPSRLMSERPRGGVWQGVKEMLNTITTKGGLTVTTALVACGFLFLSPQGQELWRANAPVINNPEPEADPVIDQTPEADDAALANQTAQQESPVVALPGTDGQALTDNRSETPQEEAPLAEAAAEMTASEGGAPPMPATVAPTEQALTRRLSPATNGLNLDGMVMGGIVAPAPMVDGGFIQPLPDTEAFANAADNPLKITAEAPVSTFSIDVDTASYAVVRQSLNAGFLPNPEAVRVEEMINYFPYAYPAPEADGAPFLPTVSLFETPWNPDTQLLHIALQGEMPALADRPPLNLVFLIDTSGSMADANKLPLLKQSIRLMLDQLRPEDQVAIVEYAGSAGLVLQATAASERQTILNALQSLGAGGSTNGQGGLEQAYAVAASMAADGEVGRVILATDGDFNVGAIGTDTLTDYIAAKRDSGVYLSVLGFGRGNLGDATMQALAQNGNGTAAYIDTLNEAQKVLVDQLTGALFPIAGDVKVQIEFNPATVAEYRLVGYETRALNHEDFNNDAVDAGELGAGHSVTAIYEITPVGSPAQLSDPLRYADAMTASETTDELGFLKLRWKEPGADESQLLTTPITVNTTVAGTEAQFAAAIAGFGQLLRGQDLYLGDWSYAEAIALANANRGEDAFGYRNEAVQLMRLAQSLTD